MLEFPIICEALFRVALRLYFSNSLAVTDGGKCRYLQFGQATRWRHYGIAFRRNYTLDHAIPAFDSYTPYDVVPRPRTSTLPFRNLNVAGREYRTWLINPTILLPQLVSDLKRSHVPFRRRTFADVQSLAELKEDIIVNCTGYGAKTLVQDDQMLARRGHLVLLRRTLARQFYFFSGGCANYRTMCVLCRQRDIVIGGSVQDGNESEGASSNDDAMFCRIRENARNVFEGRPRQCR